MRAAALVLLLARAQCFAPPARLVRSAPPLARGPRRCGTPATTTTTTARAALPDALLLAADTAARPPSVVPIIVAAAVLAVGAGLVQLNVVLGDQGLANFLKDGRGLNGSGYKKRSKADVEKEQQANAQGPLSFLTSMMPKLPFVEVYGQVENDEGARANAERAFVAEASRLQDLLRAAIAGGDQGGELQLRAELNELLSGSPFDLELEER